MLSFLPLIVKPRDAMEPPFSGAYPCGAEKSRQYRFWNGPGMIQGQMMRRVMRDIRALRPRCGLAALGMLAWAHPAMAHPHVTFVARADIVLDTTGKISTIRHSWTFDEAYSAYAVTGMKPGADGRITRKDLEDLSKLNVESLSEFGFFTVLKAGRTAVKFNEPPPGYYLEHDGKALTLHFDLPLQAPVAPATGMSLKIDDETFFVAFSLAEKEPIRIVGTTACTIELKRPAQSLAGPHSPKLTEDFFNNLKTGFSDQYATTVRLACP